MPLQIVTELANLLFFGRVLDQLTETVFCGQEQLPVPWSPPWLIAKFSVWKFGCTLQANYFYQTLVLTFRSLLNNWRNVGIFWLRLAM